MIQAPVSLRWQTTAQPSSMNAILEVGIALVADPEPAQVVQPGEGALHDPAFLAEPGAVLGVASGDHGLHTTLPELAAILVVVIAPVSEHPLSTPAWTPGLAPHGTDAVDERQ